MRRPGEPRPSPKPLFLTSASTSCCFRATGSRGVRQTPSLRRRGVEVARRPPPHSALGRGKNFAWSAPWNFNTDA